MIPIWRKNKNELSDEDYNNFYKDKFNDYSEPLSHSHVHNEGMPTYDALLYIPSRAPFDFYSKEYKKGLQLYANGVLIMDCCEDLLPDYFRFVRGVVDSPDLSLNISRAILQHSRQLLRIKNRKAQIHGAALHAKGHLPPAQGGAQHAAALLGGRGGQRRHLLVGCAAGGVAQHFPQIHLRQRGAPALNRGHHLPKISDRLRWICAATSGLFMV